MEANPVCWDAYFREECSEEIKHLLVGDWVAGLVLEKRSMRVLVWCFVPGVVQPMDWAKGGARREKRYVNSEAVDVCLGLAEVQGCVVVKPCYIGSGENRIL